MSLLISIQMCDKSHRPLVYANTKRGTMVDEVGKLFRRVSLADARQFLTLLYKLPVAAGERTGLRLTGCAFSHFVATLPHNLQFKSAILTDIDFAQFHVATLAHIPSLQTNGIIAD